MVVRTWREVILTIWTFFKAKNLNIEHWILNLNIELKYWTLIKIKIGVTCVHKEYEIKIKLVHMQWLQLKMKFLVVYNMKIVIF